jgi:CTD small phosphatase-like protein 2
MSFQLDCTAPLCEVVSSADFVVLPSSSTSSRRRKRGLVPACSYGGDVCAGSSSCSEASDDDGISCDGIPAPLPIHHGEGRRSASCSPSPSSSDGEREQKEEAHNHTPRKIRRGSKDYHFTSTTAATSLATFAFMSSSSFPNDDGDLSSDSDDCTDAQESDSDSGVSELLPAVSSLLTSCAKPVAPPAPPSAASTTPLGPTRATTTTTASNASPCSVTQGLGPLLPKNLHESTEADEAETAAAAATAGMASAVSSVECCEEDHLSQGGGKEELSGDEDSDTAADAEDADDEAAAGAALEHEPRDMAPFTMSLQSYLVMTSLPPHSYVRSVHHPHMPAALLPPKAPGARKVTLVLDLDETLVHCGFTEVPGADIRLQIEYGGAPYTVVGKRRPHLRAFLREAARHFELVCFTASQQLYAEKIVQLIDPDGCISHSLYRDACVHVRGTFVKDLALLGRDLRHTLLLDNSPHVFGFHPDNGVPISSWFDDDADAELPATLAWLRTLAGADDVRPGVAAKFRMRERLACPLYAQELRRADAEAQARLASANAADGGGGGGAAAVGL